MNITKVLVIFGRLPALFLVTAVYLALLRDILPEVSAFLRLHFHSNAQEQILEGNLSITVFVEIVEDFVELLLSDDDAPEIEHPPEFIFRYFARLFSI
jgi:hypothetical protein